MDELQVFFSDRKFVQTVLVAFLTVIYVLTAQKFFSFSKERRKKKEARLYEAISNGIQANTLISLEDFVNVYKGIYELGSDDVTHRAGLAKVLREFIVRTIAESTSDPNEAKKRKDFATAVLRKIEADSPFVDLPAAERNLLIDIDRFVRAKDEESAISKLQDLAGRIEVRQDSLDRISSTNKWSVPLAVIGLILTVVFGIISIFK